MLTAKKNKESKFEIWGSGKPIREWGYIKDIASLLVQSIQLKEDVLYPVNLAQKKGYSIKESAKIIADLIGFGGKIEFNKKYQDGALRKVLDNKKFKKFFPKFKFTEHTQALKETVEYYKKELSIQ
jgi:GDP-L-fucose synthase